MGKVNIHKREKLTFETASRLFELAPELESGLCWKVDRVSHKIKGVIAGTKMQQKSGHTSYLVQVNSVLYQSHHLVWLLHYGAWPDPELMVDHIIGLDAGGNNSIENLRLVTSQQNSRGHRVRIPTGYYWVKRRHKFQVQLIHPKTGKKIHVKYTETEEDAKKYVQAAHYVWRVLYPECFPEELQKAS